MKNDGTIQGTAPPLNSEQSKVVEMCDTLLTKQGLMSYTQLQEQVAMMGVACLESIETGKKLLVKVGQLEQANKHS